MSGKSEAHTRDKSLFLLIYQSCLEGDDQIKKQGFRSKDSKKNPITHKYPDLSTNVSLGQKS